MAWEVKKLGDVCDVEYGTRVVQKRDGGTIFPVYGGGGATFFMDQSNRKDCLVIARFAMSKKCTRFVKGNFFLNDSGLSVIPKDKNKLCQEFLNYHFLYLNNYIYSLGRGTAQKNLDVPKFRKIKIYFPDSIKKQKQILDILDKAFEKISKAKENTEKNLKNSKEVFESYSQKVFENPGEDWEENKLGDVCNIIGGGTPSKKKDEFYNGDILWATVRDMKYDIIKDTEHKITKNAVKDSSTNIIPKKNVIIATRVGLGKVCLLQNDTAINQDLKGIIPKNQKTLSIDFLFSWFKSNSKKIIDEGTGATVQGVKLPFIKSLVVHLPLLTEQQAIVRKLNALSAETKKLESVYTQKLTDLKELKQSILQKAFIGKLVEVLA